MSDSPYIFNVTQDDFASVVLEESQRVPVLVDFWAAWCGPCQTLMPMLARLVEEYDGQFLLAKVNTDEQQALATQHGVRSLPTVKVFKAGQVVDEFMGAQPESVIRGMLERHIVRESDRLRDTAMATYEQGHAEEGLAMLEQAVEGDPGNARIRLDLATLLAAQGQLERAEEILNGLPAEMRDDEAVKALGGRLRYARIAAEAPDAGSLGRSIDQDPGDLESRYRLAARAIADGQHEQALDQFLEIMKRDRGFREGAAREGMLAVFEMLGGGGELVARYRRQLANLMH
ncbi:MAG: thioredoxin [Chromatiales bacterium]|jgi:putative thioredoxin